MSISSLSSWIEKLYKSGLKRQSPIKPYHLEHYRREWLYQIAYWSINEGYPYIYLENKFDGTHVVFAPTGIFKHSGLTIDEWQLRGLLKAVENVPEKFKWLRENVDAGFIVALELYGNAYTPMHVHLNHKYNWDIQPFEVAKERFETGKYLWLPPHLRYRLWDEIFAPIYVDRLSFYDVADVDRIDERIREATENCLYEGIVVKSATDKRISKPYTRNTLIIMKSKPLKYRHRPKSKKPKKKAKKKDTTTVREGTPEYDEIVNEIAKILATKEIEPHIRNTRKVIELVTERLMDAHPEMFRDIDRKILGRTIAKIWIRRVT